MNETSKKVKDETEKIIIRMKMAEIAAKLSVPGRTKRHLKKNTGVLRLCWEYVNKPPANSKNVSVAGGFNFTFKLH